MSEFHDFTAEDRRRQERRIWRTGLWLSLLVHLLIFWASRGTVIPLSPFAAAGPRAGDNRAASGSMQAVSLREPPSVQMVPPLIPIPTDIAIEPVQFEQEVVMDPASVLGEEPGLDAAPGLENGDGQGDGGDSDEGFYRLQPPVPQGVIIPPSHNSLRGKEVRVWVFVNERGGVIPDSTRLEPPTTSRDLNRQLIREASEWRFRPAVQEGKAVASWYPYRIIG
jgi:hypothetical protein